MRALIGFALVTLLAWSAFAEEMTSVVINGHQYNDIKNVIFGSNGQITILSRKGIMSISVDDVPTNFLASWNISPQAAKTREKQRDAEVLDNAIASGCFREIKGVVYDARQTGTGWVRIPRAKLVQFGSDGAILNITPGTTSLVAVHVRHLPNTISDTDLFGFTAKLVGNYSYVNKLGVSRTILDYDVGRPCLRESIPQSVLSGQKAFDTMALAGSTGTDAIASLPESDDLKASGSGFFITDDGYVISNNHVVENAAKVKIRTHAGTVDARVVQVDAANDLALLKVDGAFSPLPIAASRNVHLGANVTTVGFPSIRSQGFAPKFAKGEIACLSGIKDDPKYFQISVPLQHGNSGGALVDERGNVVGVVTAKLGVAIDRAHTSDELPENVNYAVKSSILLSFLEAVPEVSGKLKEPVGKEQKFDDVVKAAEDAAALVLVYRN